MLPSSIQQNILFQVLKPSLKDSRWKRVNSALSLLPAVSRKPTDYKVIEKQCCSDSFNPPEFFKSDLKSLHFSMWTCVNVWPVVAVFEKLGLTTEKNELTKKLSDFGEFDS